HLRSDVVDQHGTVDAAGVEEFQERLGRAAELDNLVEVRALLLHQLQRVRLEHLHRLDVDVAIGDHSVWLPHFARIVCAKIEVFLRAAFYQSAANVAGQGTNDDQSIPR